MPTREEIREGIDRDIEFVLQAAYYAGGTGESISETVDKCKLHLKKALHSQGVVIKVESNSDDIHLPVLKEAWEGMVGDMEELGYVAVEPLVEK